MLPVQVYLYYELDKYYQNHKRYVRSRDDNQLAGELFWSIWLSSTLQHPSACSVGQCHPIGGRK